MLSEICRYIMLLTILVSFGNNHMYSQRFHKPVSSENSADEDSIALNLALISEQSRQVLILSITNKTSAAITFCVDIKKAFFTLDPIITTPNALRPSYLGIFSLNNADYPHKVKGKCLIIKPMKSVQLKISLDSIYWLNQNSSIISGDRSVYIMPGAYRISFNYVANQNSNISLNSDIKYLNKIYESNSLLIKISN